MFKGLKHLSKALELLSTALEHKFKGLEHKISLKGNKKILGEKEKLYKGNYNGKLLGI